MPRRPTRDMTADPAAYFGNELREIRQDAGFATQAALAAELGFDTSVIAHAEQGRRPPTANVLTKWLDACGVRDAHRASVERLAVLASSSERAVPTWFEDYLEIEPKALTICLWQPIIIPGLLQSEGYTRALYDGQGMEPDRLDAIVAARLSRQGIITRPDPPDIIAVLDAHVLSRQIGTPAVMATNLAYLAKLTERPNVTIQVRPADTLAKVGLSCSFTILTLDGQPEVVHTDGEEDQTRDDRKLVRQARRTFDKARRDAVPHERSRETLLEAADKWMTEV